MPDNLGQTNFFRSFRFDFHDQDRVVMEISETKNLERREKVIPLDFSLSGLALISRNKFEIGAEVLLKIKFKKNSYEIHGTIVRGKWNSQYDSYHFGIQFHDQSQADTLSLMDRYLVSLPKKRLKENILNALKNSSGRFHQTPSLDDMVIFLLNTFHLQGGAEEILPEALDYAKQRGLIDGEYKVRLATPAETKYSARLSDLFDQPKFDIFSDEKNIKGVLNEVMRTLFSTQHQRFVGFADPKKSREYALVGQSDLIKNYRSQLTHILSEPCCVLFTGEKGSGKTHFSNVIREELRKKNHRSILMNPLTDIDCYRELLSNEGLCDHVLILDNLDNLKQEVVQKVIALSKNNWVILNSRSKLEIPFSGRLFEFELTGLNTRPEDIAPLVHYYLRRRHSLHITIEREFLDSFVSKKYKRGVWQLFEMLDTFVFHIMMRETIDWPSHEVYPEFDHSQHQIYQNISGKVELNLQAGKNKEQIIEDLFAEYLNEYASVHGKDVLEEEHLDLLQYHKKRAA